MEALILDRTFETQVIIDSFESFIWTDRYNTPGDFEIYMPAAKAPFEFIKEGYFIWIRDSDRLQIIEDIEIDTDAEDGDKLIFNGRTLESLLERRRVYTKTEIDSSLQEGLQKLLNENLINPSDSSRRIENFRFIWTDNAEISKLTMINTFFGETLLDIVETYCESYDLGFKVVFNENDKTFDFSLYYGENRGYSQEKNPWVVFSAEYENLVGSNYLESCKKLRTAAVVVSDEDDDYGQVRVEVVGQSELTGIDRRELYVDANDIRWPDIDEDGIRKEGESRGWDESRIRQEIERATRTARSSMEAQLKERGEQALAETYVTKSFEGEIEALRQYVYGIDFFIGDVVQVRNHYGMEASSRITEVVRSHDVNGYKLSPTFTTLIGESNVTGKE